jgi:DNA-binding NtrC family response regulator
MLNSLALSCSTVVIVDGYSLSASVLADRIRMLGAKVHVVNSAAAAGMLVRNKKIDVVFIGYRLADGAFGLTKMLDQYGVPYITCGTPTDMGQFASDFKSMEQGVSA